MFVCASQVLQSTAPAQRAQEGSVLFAKYFESVILYGILGTAFDSRGMSLPGEIISSLKYCEHPSLAEPQRRWRLYEIIRNSILIYCQYN